MDRIITERNVPNNYVKIIVREGYFFKALFKYRCVGVQFFCNPGGDGVKFNACPMSALQSIRHKSEKMPYAHSRLKRFTVFPYAKLFQSIPDCLNHKR